jgi:biotin carboxyl carrier protein
MKVTPIGPNLYCVDDGQRQWTVAVAGPPHDQWVWIDGQVARVEAESAAGSRRRSTRDDLTSPMPATVIRVAVEAGSRVARGDTLILLEAMKMELPIRAPRDAIVKAVHCAAGDLVQPGVNLIDLD